MIIRGIAITNPRDFASAVDEELVPLLLNDVVSVYLVDADTGRAFVE